MMNSTQLESSHDWVETPVVRHTVTVTTEQLTDLKLSQPTKQYRTYSTLRSAAAAAADSDALPSPGRLLRDSVFQDPDDLAANDLGLIRPRRMLPPSPLLNDDIQNYDCLGIHNAQGREAALPFDRDGVVSDMVSPVSPVSPMSPVSPLSPMIGQDDSAAHQSEEFSMQMDGSQRVKRQEEEDNKPQLLELEDKMPATPSLAAADNGSSFSSTLGLDLNLSCRLGNGADGTEPLTLSLTVDEEIIPPTNTTTTTTNTSTCPSSSSFSSSSEATGQQRATPRACRSKGSFTRRQIKMKYRITQRRSAHPAENAGMRDPQQS